MSGAHQYGSQMMSPKNLAITLLIVAGRRPSPFLSWRRFRSAFQDEQRRQAEHDRASLVALYLCLRHDAPQGHPHSEMLRTLKSSALYSRGRFGAELPRRLNRLDNALRQNPDDVEARLREVLEQIEDILGYRPEGEFYMSYPDCGHLGR